MIWYEKTYKKISKEEYKKLTKGMSKVEQLLLAVGVCKKLKPEITETFPPIRGLVEYCKHQENIRKIEYTEDNYEYFIEDGYSMQIMGNDKTIEAFKQAVEQAFNK